MKKLRFIFLALLFFLARPESAMASNATWQGKQYRFSLPSSIASHCTLWSG